MMLAAVADYMSLQYISYERDINPVSFIMGSKRIVTAITFFVGVYLLFAGQVSPQKTGCLC